MAINIPIVTQFDGKGIQKAIKQFKQLETNGQKAAFVLKKMGQAAALGFAAVGVAALGAGKFMLDFAKMARADQLAQVQLAGTLKSTTKATDAQIKSVEDYIDVTQRATGVADDQLRPSFARLVRSTKDVSKAQKLLNLALDISGRTGKPLEAVVNGLARASEGQNTALARLGLGYSKAELKAKSFSTVQEELTKQYAGGASEKAATFEGIMDRLRITFDELKESAGVAFIPVLETLAKSAIEVADAFGKKGMAGAIDELKFQLQFLFYDAEGNLNAMGKQINSIVGLLGRIKQGANLGALGTKLPDFLKPESMETITNPVLKETIDPKMLRQQRRGITASQGLGMSNYIRQNPGSVVTVNVGPTANLADVGKEIKKAIAAADRQDGGYGSRSGNR